MPLSGNQFTNLNLTQIAAKRLSGKAQTNSNFSIAEEGYGSTVQTLSQTVFGEGVPNNPNPTWATHQFIIQSSSGGPGSVQLVEFEVEPFGAQYANSTDSDAGDSSDQGTSGGATTYHAYALKLTGSYESEPNNNLNSKASGNYTAGTDPFSDGYFMSGSGGRLQIVPEYASNIVSTGDPTTGNPYTPYLISQGANSEQITIGSDIDWYLDTYAGILFIQDPADWTSGTATDKPKIVRCFIYTGKYQDQISGGDTVDLHISASAGTGFSLSNSATASFVSGTAGISVTAGSPNTITIGSATDNVTFNNITASIINADKIEASEYIISSSITYMTQSFSSGSTIFGDTNDDTHQFTGSVSILHTGSGYGFQMSGSNFLIDYGDSGSVTLGKYNVGAEFGGFALPITGSGLIISQSFTNEATHHNMVKIGETELVDISGSLQTDAFLINVREKALIVSSSFLDKPVVRLANANHALYSGNNPALSIGPTNVTLQNINDINLIPSNDLKMRVQLGDNTGQDPSSVEYIIAASSNPNANAVKFSSYSASFFLPALGGALTASAVSSSGLLFASLSGNPTHNDGILAIVYDTGSGQFYYTGSYGAGGGDTTDLEASASAGIYFWTGSGTGTSIGLMQTASFTSSGAGLGVDFNETTNTFTYTLTPQDVFDAFDTANTGSFTASYANTASLATSASYASTASVIFVSESSDDTDYSLVFTNSPGSTNLYTDNAAANNFTYNPSDGTLEITNTSPSLLISSSVVTNYTDIRIGSIIITGSTYNAFNSQGPNGNIDTTLNIGGQTHTINIGAPANYSGSVVNFKNDVTIAGSASIEGDLIVRGAVTSVETTNLNVTDQFILLNSGSNSGNGGIIIQTADNDGTPKGPALFLDTNVTRFAVAKGIPWNQTSDITQDNNSTMQYIVTITSSFGAPTAGALEWGTDGAASAQYGNMYVDENTGDIYIYGG